MHFFKPQFKQVLLFCIFVIFSSSVFAQVTIASQNFDTTGLGYTVSDINDVTVTSSTFESSPNSLWFGSATNASVIFDNVDISTYSSVLVTLSFSSINANNNKNLFLDISYDNGVNWEPEIKLIEGENGGGGETWSWGTPDNDPAGVVSVNPYTYTVPAGNSQVRIRVRASSANNRYFFIDNIIIRGTPKCNTIGNILLERYDGITGTSIASLIAAPNYPNTPSAISNPTSFEAPTNIAEDYGVRMRGTICAPETGTYYFWVAGDDNVELNLSTDNTEANKTQIAYHNSWTNSREWNKFTTQKSVGITLFAGQSYYIEALMKEGGGGDNLAVGWRKPSDGNAASPVEVIPGSYLSPPTLVPEINIQGNSTNILDGDTTPTTADHTDFGNVNTTGGTLIRTFTIQNSGLGVLNLSGTPRVAISGTNASDFTVTAVPSATVAGSGGSTTFQITFDPSADGVRNATVTIANNDSNENPYDFSIRGTGVTTCTNPAAPSLVLPSGATSICSGNSLNLNATSAGNTIYWYTQATGGSSIGNSVSGTNFSVSPTSNTTYYAEARTNTGGCISATRTATALITVNNPPTATINYSGSPFCRSVSTAQSVTLTGTGAYTGGTYSASPAGLTINSSTGAITPSTSTAGTYTVTYTIAASGGCAAVNATRSVTITAVPVATFSYTGTPYCSSGTNPTPTFSGGGVAGTFSSTAGLNFVSTSTGQINLSSSTPGTYTVTNTIAASGGCVTVAATSSITINAAPTISSTTPGSNNGPGTVNLSATASVGSTISWYANSTGGTALGTGPSFTTPGIIATTTYYVEASNGICTPSARVAVVATIHYAEITVLGNGNIILDEDTSPVTTDYTNLGSTGIGVGLTRTYTIQNSGTINLTIGAITISGVNASEFVVITAPAVSVAPSGSTTFSIRFTPTALGTRNANISFVTNDPDENPFNFDISGTGSTGLIPEINLQGFGNNIIDGSAGTSSLNGTDFGSTTIPGTIVRTFTIQNTGTGPLLLTGLPIVVITGSSDFTVTSQPSSNTIAAGSSLTFQITYNPAVTGTSLGIVSINNNDSNETIYDFAIKANATVSGREIDIQGNDTSIVAGDTTPDVVDQTDFGVTDTSTPISIVYTVHSFGSSSLTINSTVSITGANSSMFTATPVANTTIGPGTGRYVTHFVVTFIPTASLGVKTATITVNNNDSDESTYSFVVKAEVQSIPAQVYAPGGVTSNLKFWLKADSNIGSLSDNSSILTWVDQTFGSTKNALSRFSKEPKFRNNPANNVNFNPVVHFNGNNYMSGGQGFNNSDMFIVVKPTNDVNYTTSPMDIYCGDDKSTNRESQDVTGFEMGNTSARHSNELIAYNQGAETSYGVSEISTTKIYSGVNIFNPRKHSTFPTTKMDILNNGNTLATSTANNSSYLDIVNSRYWLGRSEYWDASYDGDILEIINYNNRNNDADKRKIETYLAIKYGITLGLNGTSFDYVNSAGTVIYGAAQSYNYNIAGIGRDDNSRLNQKQSKTENTINDITIGLGNIYDTNSNNPNTFSNNRDFLVWGHNNNTLAAQLPIVVNMSASITPLLTTNVEFISIGRTWRVIESGGNVPSCKVSIPSTMLTATINPPGDFLMFISDSPVFNPTAEYRIMRTNGTNLEANYDFSGTKYITFGYAPEKTFSRSIYFNGSTDYLDAGNTLNLSSSFTISAWVKRINSNASIISKRNSAFANGGYDLKIDAAGRLEMTWKNGSTQTITSSVVIPSNVWHHVAIVYNGTQAKIFIDGVEDVTQTKNLTAPITNNEFFLVAAADGLYGSTTSFFNGNIDEVRVWNTALTDNQLRYIMNQEIQRNGTLVTGAFFQNLSISPTKNDISSVPWSNLVGYYPMSTYTYTNCKDASGNGNTAAVKNLQTVDLQTAPLPYVSTFDTNWNLNSTWQNGLVQSIPGAASIIAATLDRDGDSDIDNDDKYTIDWNIVQISSNVTLDNTTLPAVNRGNRSVLGLFVDSTKKLSVNGSNPTGTSGLNGTGNGISVSHILSLNGKIDLQGESQLIQTTNSDLTAGALGEIEKDQQGVGNKYRYNDWSSPVIKTGTTSVTGFTVPSVLKDGTNPSSLSPISFVSGYDGSIGSPLKIAEYWIYKYANDLTNDYSKWNQIKSSGLLYPGEGFLMKGTGASGDQNYAFVGKPNNGDVSLILNNDNDYLVGNPYPSAMDAEAFIIDNPSLTGAIYYWEHYGGNDHILRNYQAGYATFNLSGGVKATSHSSVSNLGNSAKRPGRFISVGQGFFVQGNGTAGPKNIIFKNSQRVFVKESVVGTDTVSIFMRPTSEKTYQKKTANNGTIADKRLKIWLNFDTPKIDERQLLLTFDDRASMNEDWGFDAAIYEELNDDLYWVIGKNKFVIQGVDTESISKDIPLGLKLSAKGKVSIKLDNVLNELPEMEVFLKDSLLQEKYPLKEGKFEKEFEKGDYSNRFYLTFKYAPPIKVDPFEAIEIDEFQKTIDDLSLFYNNANAELVIDNKIDAEIYGIKLMNYLGQYIAEWNITYNENQIKIPLKIATGVYFIQIKTRKGTINKKILIK